jgi:hypothetical protein
MQGVKDNIDDMVSLGRVVDTHIISEIGGGKSPSPPETCITPSSEMCSMILAFLLQVYVAK